MKTYNHAFTFPFEVVSENEGPNVTPYEMRQAIKAAISGMSDLEILEACGMPFDTYCEGLK